MGHMQQGIRQPQSSSLMHHQQSARLPYHASLNDVHLLQDVSVHKRLSQRPLLGQHMPLSQLPLLRQHRSLSQLPSFRLLMCAHQSISWMLPWMLCLVAWHPRPKSNMTPAGSMLWWVNCQRMVHQHTANALPSHNKGFVDCTASCAMRAQD